MLFFYQAFRKIVRLDGRTLAVFAAIFFLLSPFVIQALEPEKFTSWFRSLWWVIVTATTVGYGDYFPVTAPGMVFGIVVIFIGLFLIGSIVGKTTENFVSWKKQREEGRLAYQGKDHYVVIGWSEEKIRDMIEELLLADPAREVVLVAKLEKTPMAEHRVHYIQGDATEYATLDRANVCACKAVVIFSPEGVHNSSLADGHTLLIATTLESYAARQGKEIYTIAEILKESHRHSFRHAKVDELILSQQSISHLIASSTVNQGSSRLFMNLMSKDSGDELYGIAKRPEWRTYNDAYEWLKARGALLVADGDDTGIIRRLGDTIPEKARLFIIADTATYEALTGDGAGAHAPTRRQTP
ncbi:potassium channel family protein [Paenibacillus sp. FSL W8-1187]|uniref:potassium channel family protein n=1 Tax=Paenibacillus sp. FSL W8-1187 TaxID=2975339 RepID=UPI0030DB1D93